MVGNPAQPEKTDLEAKVIAFAESGNQFSLADLGSLQAIATNAAALGMSPMMPEVLRPLLRYWSSACTGDRATLNDVLRDILESASIDFVLAESIDVLDAHRPLPDQADDTCFTIFLTKAGRKHGGLSGLARGACLEGAFRWAISNRRWQLRLLDFLLGVSAEDEPEFLRHAAKIIGVAYSHWREEGLLERLTQLAQLESAEVEAAFELGMAKLADGLGTALQAQAQTHLTEARAWFSRSVSASETNPEALLYLDCLEILTEYSAGEDKRQLSVTRDRVSANAFELAARHQRASTPSWLGSRHTEAICWSVLANTLTELVERLEEASWWEPGVVVEQYVLSAYTASRSILRRSEDGSLAALLRPRIQSSIAARGGQAYQLKAWLSRNADHQWAEQAVHLISEVDQLIDREKKPENPSEAATEVPSIAALIDRADIPAEAKWRMTEVISNAFSVQLCNITKAEVEVIERCREPVEDHPDFRYNAYGKQLFDAVLMWTVRFVFVRLEVSQKDDPTVAYLFERADGKLAHEDQLQDDFFRWISTNAAGSDLEPTNIGGGRGDIRLKSRSERLVIEVKRELNNSSFEAIATSYAAQATDYQNVSIRLGFLLVLDLATGNREGTPHITSLFQTREVQRTGEATPRSLTIVKVPGRRKRPSDLTKLAKSKKEE